ncbi:hypothetical protein BDR26DRAFT_837311 [Obelidium mucronatum]|nr:hypothetical protein BDR26DRAFT_837311 [Obelidium mucronatum]
MVLANKVIMSTFNFKHAFLILSFQTFITATILIVCSRAGLISYRQLNSKDALKWLPVTITLVLMIYTGAMALQYTSIALFNIYKNMTLIMTAYGERLLLKGPVVTPMILLSFVFMVLSAVLAGWDEVVHASAKDKADIITSYIWIFANCVLTASFSLIMKSQISGIGFKDFDTVYYNQVLGFPILLICSLLFERDAFVELISRFLGRAGEGSDWNGLATAIFVSGITQFGIAYCSAWCLRVTSSTTLSMVGTLNKLPLSIVSMLIFQDNITIYRLEGVFLAILGGVLYGQARTTQARKQKRIAIVLPFDLGDVEKEGLIAFKS